ncbi:extracellular solute-binding protein [Georgenia sp. MJ206]|uniref:extracellular solute-binding protein n=1 Tax=Georgenia wangjunii TaxID=3117730 RepID=UPI002F2681FD
MTTTAPADLPDVLEYDGPMMASLIYAQKLAPVGDLVSAETLENQTDSVLAQNTNPDDGEIYGISQFDASLGIYANTDMLDAAGVTYPEGLDDAWTADEFEAALEALAATDDDGRVLDIKENYGAEWPTYGFLPVVWSAGEHIIEDNTADGHINSDAAVAAVERFAGWRDYIDPNTDDAAFVDGRVALSWVGHWMYNPYSEALGDSLAVLPLPDFGQGAKSGQGSWGWGINPESDNPEGAGAFLDYLATDDAVAAMTDANAAPPGTTTVLEQSELYGADGPLALFAESLARTCGDGDLSPDCVAVPRPITPAYPVISQQFSEAFFGAYEGGDARELLDSAARTIDLDFQDNENYGLD